MNPIIWEEGRGFRPFIKPRRSWKLYAITMGFAFTVGVIGGYALHSFQMGVALDTLHATTERLIIRTEHLEHPARSVTKAAAQVLTAKREKDEH